jgi:hypothetical protein
MREDPHSGEASVEGQGEEVNYKDHPLAQLIDKYEAKAITEDELRKAASQLSVQTVKVAITVHVKLTKVIDMDVTTLAEAAIDESGDVYSDAVDEKMDAAFKGLHTWDDFNVEEEDHEWVDSEGRRMA